MFIYQKTVGVGSPLQSMPHLAIGPSMGFILLSRTSIQNMFGCSHNAYVTTALVDLPEICFYHLSDHNNSMHYTVLCFEKNFVCEQFFFMQSIKQMFPPRYS